MPTDNKTLEQQFREVIEEHCDAEGGNYYESATLTGTDEAARACASLASEKLREIEEERDRLREEVARLKVDVERRHDRPSIGNRLFDDPEEDYDDTPIGGFH